MRYFIISGEVSGDLYAKQLMQALAEADPAGRVQIQGTRQQVGRDGICGGSQTAGFPHQRNCAGVGKMSLNMLPMC